MTRRLRPRFAFFLVWFVVFMVGWLLITRLTDLIPSRLIATAVWGAGVTCWGWAAFNYVVANVRAQVLQELADTSPHDGGASLN